jgi:hypothetical protein
MSSKEKTMSDDEKTEVEEVEVEEEVDTNDDDEDDDDESDQDGGNNIPIDLSKNEVYRGICTLLEDEDGNNILEYISLLHTELIGINKSLENLKLIRKDMSRIADCAELFLKSTGGVSPEKSNSVNELVKKSKKTIK